MPTSWTFSDWITFDEGSPTRLARLRTHIKEVSDAISSGNFSTEKKSHDFTILEQYLEKLLATETIEARRADMLSGKRSAFTRGKAIMPGLNRFPVKGVPFPP